MVPDFQIIKDKVLHTLAACIAPGFTYHNVQHTAEVLSNVERIAKEEGITDDRSLLLLKIAALYHDMGFLVINKGHEEVSCQMARHDLANGTFSKEELDTICSIIMATRVPQTPTNHLEQIICDADLDYLGRDDFEILSNKLMLEYLQQGIVTTEAEWMAVQLKFIESHHYFTKSSQRNRNPKKLKHLENLKAKKQEFTTNQ
jgi:predicted metal-dependent HD superfamily phosphohydrolase